jgi:hypothetical protein
MTTEIGPLDRLRAELESARRRLHSEIEGIEGEEWARRPGRDWSIGQVMEHLARAEASIVNGARNALDRGRGAKPGLTDGVRRFIWRSGVTNLMRVRTSERLDPPEAPPRAEVLARLASSREGLLQVLESAAGRDLANLRLKHPFFGALPFLDMIGFVAWHEDRHRRQIVRIKRAFARR